MIKKTLKDCRLNLIGRPAKLLMVRAESSYEQIRPSLIMGARVVDIGCGGGQISKLLQDKGFEVSPVDVKDSSWMESVQPIIFDGLKLPFVNNAFDIALLLTVLHHAEDEVALLREAKRVAKRIIIIEDIYETIWGKYRTQLLDNTLNLDFFPGHHANRTDAGWKELFKQEELKLLRSEYWRTWVGPVYMDQALYCVERD